MTVSVPGLNFDLIGQRVESPKCSRVGLVAAQIIEDDSKRSVLLFAKYFRLTTAARALRPVSGPKLWGFVFVHGACFSAWSRPGEHFIRRASLLDATSESARPAPGRCMVKWPDGARSSLF